MWVWRKALLKKNMEFSLFSFPSFHIYNFFSHKSLWKEDQKFVKCTEMWNMCATSVCRDLVSSVTERHVASANQPALCCRRIRPRLFVSWSFPVPMMTWVCVTALNTQRRRSTHCFQKLLQYDRTVTGLEQRCIFSTWLLSQIKQHTIENHVSVINDFSFFWIVG